MPGIDYGLVSIPDMAITPVLVVLGLLAHRLATAERRRRAFLKSVQPDLGPVIPGDGGDRPC